MAKRIFSFSLVLALLILCVTPVLANTTMYVYTDNRKPLNVRSAPYVGDNLIATAPYGAAINVIQLQDDGWAKIQWTPSVVAYVQSRYLQWTRPDLSTPVPATPAPTPVPTAVPYYPTAAPYYPTAEPYSYYTDSLATLNAEFRTARIVTPFTIIVRPARSSGWVNMRWAPSKDVEMITTYRNGVRLTVIAETQSWYQVVDPDSEATGFIMKAYTTRVN
ncbi:MAG: SH3 domain-containing protein [Clostridia bacterium]|nr:SH3 domain-containing protein [Clostridia bacterium]